MNKKCHITRCSNTDIERSYYFQKTEYNYCAEHSTQSYVWSGYAFENYKILERDFLNYLKVVPVNPLGEGLDLATRIHADFLIRICTQIELVFRDWLFHFHLSNNPEIDNFRKENASINIHKYHDLLFNEIMADENNYNQVKVWPLRKSINPFEDWKSNTPPFWWTAYNKLKHNGFFHRKEGTLENVIYALAALFFINCRHPNSHNYLIKYYLPLLKDSSSKVREIKSYETPHGQRDFLFQLETLYTTTSNKDSL